MHSAQGVTIGRGKALQQCLLLWTMRAERLTPGLFYTGVTRPTDVAAFALDQPISLHDAKRIGVFTIAVFNCNCNCDCLRMVGQCKRACAARAAMAELARKADLQMRAHAEDTPTRTFDNGLRWFCNHVRDRVGSHDQPHQLDDVVAVCDQWLAALDA